ncbi:MAG: c-type cytochrome [Pseudomonadota bacterium]
MSAQDKKFFDVFMVVLAILVAISIAIYVFSARLSADTQGRYIVEDEAYQAQIADRITPVGELVLPGEAGQRTVAAPVAVPEPVAVELTGAQVYNNACGACHTGGIGGAPMLGNADAWQARLAQGLETLRTHAVEGYQGEAGYMPAKGGNPALSDEDVYRAIDYMIAEAGL